MQKLRQDRDLGDNLRRLRKAKGLTQEQVAAKLQVMGCDVTRARYSRYETGELNLPVSQLVALTSIFHCDFNAFFEGIPF